MKTIVPASYFFVSFPSNSKQLQKQLMIKSETLILDHAEIISILDIIISIKTK